MRLPSSEQIRRSLPAQIKYEKRAALGLENVSFEDDGFSLGELGDRGGFMRSLVQGLAARRWARAVYLEKAYDSGSEADLQNAGRIVMDFRLNPPC
jgi:hypothetical protein